MRLSGIPLEKLYSLKVALKENVRDDVKAFKDQLGDGPFNSRHGLAWDLTYRNVKSTANLLGMIVVEAKRGFWEFDLVLDVNTREVLVFMKETNTNTSARTNYHYFNALLYKHESAEMGLLLDEYGEEENNLKLHIVKEILGDFSESYDKVLVMSKEVDGYKAVKTTLKLYSKESYLLDTELIPNLPHTDDGKDQNNIDQNII
ncbi:DUF5986 family protein [Enterococcus sp.]|uniref:DUF5986 family protein n=1 Tax=Enterococcus sp. TaxID=35783 RepID=UPI0028A04E96|nr:DUF5986 family protein [Enterococcus sp.]